MSAWTLHPGRRGTATPWIVALFAALLVCAAVAAGTRPRPPVAFTSGNDRYVVTVTLPDDRAGTVPVALTVTRRDGGPGVVPPVSVQAVEPAMGHATPPVLAEAVDASAFTVHGVHLMSPGHWRLLVTVAGSAPIVFPLAVTG
ncbi:MULTISPECIES: hypothetical protein [Catenuloplanes]|uniref:YtkA-like domain-containing protein n=1 Tax=Catenuloplanes niger TaxID=587534 RepID=A0AAE3ZKE9_9ACTN|nr:hypothetical protein [Catenuloplanes niger]MDR7320270.1 hypothetical protein [Catenuloplanes niger]